MWRQWCRSSRPNELESKNKSISSVWSMAAKTYMKTFKTACKTFFLFSVNKPSKLVCLRRVADEMFSDSGPYSNITSEPTDWSVARWLDSSAVTVHLCQAADAMDSTVDDPYMDWSAHYVTVTSSLITSCNCSASMSSAMSPTSDCAGELLQCCQSFKN